MNFVCLREVLKFYVFVFDWMRVKLKYVKEGLKMWRLWYGDRCLGATSKLAML